MYCTRIYCTVHIAIAHLDRTTEKKPIELAELLLPFGPQIGLGLEATCRKGWIKIFDRFCHCLDIAHGNMLHRQRRNIRQTRFQLEQTVIRHNLN